MACKFNASIQDENSNWYCKVHYKPPPPPPIEKPQIKEIKVEASEIEENKANEANNISEASDESEEIKLKHLTNLKYGDCEIRILCSTTYNTDIWFVGKDIANAIDYKGATASNKAIRKLVQDKNKIKASVKETGRNRSQKFIVFNQEGLGELLTKTKQKESIILSKWIKEKIQQLVHNQEHNNNTNNMTTVQEEKQELKSIQNNQLVIKQNGILILNNVQIQ